MLASVSTPDGSLCLAPKLLLGCDGINSGVRSSLAAWKGAQFEPVCMSSPSSELQYQMLLVPSSFDLKNLTSPDAPLLRTEPQSACERARP